MSNNTGFTTADIDTFAKLGSFRNEWRLRNVTLYVHPTDSDSVISVGEGYNGGTTAICVEARTAYARQLVNNDWSPYL